MKHIHTLLGITIMNLTTTPISQANIQQPDIAAIETVVQGVATLADLENFAALETLYSDEVEVDYSSLTGGEPELKSNQALMTEWAAILPGFDQTHHCITDISVTLNNDRTASATAQVTADHYVADLHWQVSGHYLYQLEKEMDAWKIVGHTFNLTDESGTRDVFALASEQAKQNPNDYLKQQHTRQTVQQFLKALEEKNMEAFADTLAEDMVQDMPYSPVGFPTRVTGKANVEALYSQWPETSGKTDFTSQLKFYPMTDPEKVFVEFTGEVEIIPTGRMYHQKYGGLFHIEKGKIKLYREYYNPEPFKYAFGLEKE